MPRNFCYSCRARLHASDKHGECVSCLGTTHAETALTGTECHYCGDMSLSFLRSWLAFFSESNSAPHALPLFSKKAVGQRISALGDEWAYAGFTPTYLTLSPQRVFTHSLHLPGYQSMWAKWSGVTLSSIFRFVGMRSAQSLTNKVNTLLMFRSCSR